MKMSNFVRWTFIINRLTHLVFGHLVVAVGKYKRIIQQLLTVIICYEGHYSKNKNA